MASPVLLLLLGLLLSSSGALPPPRTSFLLNSADRPLVSFSLPDVHNTTTLLLSNDGSTLYVGAQNTILSLDVSQSDVMTLKRKVQWSPTEEEVKVCTVKGKSQTVDCPNFVHVLQPINSTHLYACGSYAYDPHQAFIDIQHFSVVYQAGARGHCPFIPSKRNTAIITDGELFTATSTDFFGAIPQISRYLSKNGRPDVSLESSTNLLEEPTFVSSSLDPKEKKLYFFFTEVGNEFSFLEKLQISRVAQVCKDDVGGERTLQKKWTSFVKAPLLCQPPKQMPFNILEDMFTLQPPEGSADTDTLFYGIFTSQWSSEPESAVCVFKLQDIQAVFKGNYRTLDMKSHQWKLFQGQRSYLGKCGLEASSDNDLMQVKSTFLTADSVKPVQAPSAIEVFPGQKYSRLAVMETRAASGRLYTVLFLLTETGFLHKVVSFDQGPRVIEEIQVFTRPELVKSIVLSSSKGVVYVGTSEGVKAVPVARCSTYRSCSQCVLARDPLCGWSRSRRSCTDLDGDHEDMIQDLENENVGDKCRGENMAIVTKETYVNLAEVVRLECLKPSNLSNLSWSSSRYERLPEKLFLHSSDGSLSFHASPDTNGKYVCKAEEDGYQEAVVSYNVQQRALPRATRPKPAGDQESVFEDIATTKSVTQERKVILTNEEDPGLKNSVTEESVNHWTTAGGDEVNVESRTIKGVSRSQEDKTQGMSPTLFQALADGRSYHSELVVVSLMLAASIFVLALGALHIWKQRKTALKAERLVMEEDGKTNTSMEIRSLSSLSKEADPELKVLQ